VPASGFVLRLALEHGLTPAHPVERTEAEDSPPRLHVRDCGRACLGRANRGITRLKNGDDGHAGAKLAVAREGSQERRETPSPSCADDDGIGTDFARDSADRVAGPSEHQLWKVSRLWQPGALAQEAFKSTPPLGPSGEQSPFVESATPIPVRQPVRVYDDDIAVRSRLPSGLDDGLAPKGGAIESGDDDGGRRRR